LLALIILKPIRNSLIGSIARSPAASTSENVGGPMDLFVVAADVNAG